MEEAKPILKKKYFFFKVTSYRTYLGVGAKAERFAEPSFSIAKARETSCPWYVGSHL